MASRGQPYTLCGFSEDLDWRPLHFLEPIPAHRLCNACGVLPRVTVFLPCRHVLCKSCYEQCVLDDGHACLLDGDQFLSEEAECRDFPLKNLLKRKVKCWNEERGCDMVLAASALNKHFCNDCDHHATSCPQCSNLVLRSNVAAHLQSKCRDHAVSLTSGALEKSNSDQKAMMLALNASLDVRVVEMKDRLDKVISDHIAQSDRLSEISHCMNTVRETLLQRSSESSTLDHLASQSAVTLYSVKAVEKTLIDHRGEARLLAGNISDSIKELKEGLEYTKQTVNNLKENNTGSTLQAELRELLTADSDVNKKTCEGVIALKEALGKVLDDAARTICRKCAGSVAGIGEVKDAEKEGGPSALNKEKELASNTINIKRYEFLAKGYKAMKDSAYSDGFHRYSSEKIYIYGYHLSPGVRFNKEGDHVLLHPCVQLHKGVIDEFLQWPFNENIQLTIKHPSESKQCQTVWDTKGALVYFGRPEESSNTGAYTDCCSFPLDDLEREGYVADDKLHIVWELLPKVVAK
ncbi:TNF receptor-associated factor 6-A-like [Dermacentor silvarum]|uniref:TNF receptor-associated factor 6-A-like n=1 Tax=Dermacentor silvarum TaxID=543639 RepID=UPI00189894F1|nr:TNF receptor-associated factor 6-A-like [Dermacentor silvarum]